MAASTTIDRLFVALCAETQSVCNRRCGFCKFGQPRGAISKETMSWELIEKILANLRDLNYTGRVSWFQTNEPLLDRRMDELVARTKQVLPGCCCTLLTNGDLLDDERVRRLKDAGLDRLGVSVYDDRTWEKVQRLSRREAVDTLFDRRPAQEGAFVETRGGNIVWPVESTKPEACDMSQRDCLRPSTMLNLRPNGDAVLCCADYYGDVVMGNASRERLETIWFGAKIESYRQRLRESGRCGLKLCEGCTWEGRGHRREFP